MSDSNPSPPLAKGSYNIDWDNFDPSMNPFEASSKTKNISPPCTPNTTSDGNNSPPITTNQIKLTPGSNLIQNGGIKKQQKTQIKIKSSAKSSRSPVVAVVTPALQAGGDHVSIMGTTQQTNLTAAGDFHVNNTILNDDFSNNITETVDTKGAIDEKISENLKNQIENDDKVDLQNVDISINTVVNNAETDKIHENDIKTKDDNKILNNEHNINEDSNKNEIEDKNAINITNTKTTNNTDKKTLTNDTNDMADNNILNNDILSDTSTNIKKKPVLSSTFRKPKTSKTPSKLKHPVIANPDNIDVSLSTTTSNIDNTTSSQHNINTTPQVSTSNEPITSSKISSSIDAACTDSGFSQSMTSSQTPQESHPTTTGSEEKAPDATNNVGFDGFSGMCALKTGEMVGDISDLMGEDKMVEDKMAEDKMEARLKSVVDSDAKTPSEDFKDACDEFFDTPTWDLLQHKITPKLPTRNNDLMAFSPATDLEAGDEGSNQQSSSLRYSSSDLLRIQKDMELKFKTHLLNKEREWSHKEEQARMEFAIRLKEHEGEKNDLREKVTCLQNTLDNMKKVVTEYENTLKKLLDDKEKWSMNSRQSNNSVVMERDQALEDLQNVEKAFADQHRRYEKCKGVLEGYVKNEEVLKKCVLDLQDKCKKKDEKYRALKDHADAKMAEASEKIEKVRKAAENNSVIQQAALKKAELLNKSLEAAIDQKTRENKELTVICDELIERVNV